MENYDHEVFQVPVASTSGAHPPLHSQPVKGKAYKEPSGSRKETWNVARKPGVGESEMD